MNIKIKLNTKPANYWPNPWSRAALLKSFSPRLSTSLLATLLLFVAGCQTLPPPLTASRMSVDEAVQSHHFKRAAAILNKQQRKKQLSAPQYQQQQNLLEKADRLYSSQILQQASAKIKAQHWQEAEALLLTAERNAIHTQHYNDAFKRLSEQENHQLAALKLRTKKAKMVWLQTANNNINTLNQSTFESPLSRFNQFRYQLMIRHTNRTFFHCAKNHFESNHLIRSKSCFTYIDQEYLPPAMETEYQILSHYFAKQSPPNGPYTAQLHARLYPNAPSAAEQTGYTPTAPPAKPETRATQPPSVADQQAQLKKLVDQLQTDLANVNLLGIKTTLSTISALEAKPFSGQKKIRQAKQFLNGQITKLDQRADNLYSNERISQAHSIWEYLLKLDPNNAAIKQKQDRSQRVINKMRTLREEQPSHNSIADAIEEPWQP